MIFTLLGDMTSIYDAEGRKQAEYGYDAWGRQLWVRDAGGMEIIDAGHAGRVNPIRYRRYYYDEETGPYYLESRYYDPEVGRFINADNTEYLGKGG